ncbi:cation diffusion facilitator family transporter [Salipaludibacillus sp. HK11]|uniref:cation diffusion facilitator family transporter n=1 Tax=Salipaludibacillus sp. HK11 TaxID=3394320 RepID=UPI0039FDAAAF
MSGHHNHHHGTKNKKRLIIAMIIIGAWMFVELIGGLWTGSLALLADAGHMFSDFFNLLISFIAIVFAARAATKQKTFGNYRLEILAALLNSLALIGVSIFIIFEAIQRLMDPASVNSGPMMTIATIGLVANIGALVVLSGKSSKSNLNMRGAYLHVLGDTLGSVSAIIAGGLMLTFQWYWADPLLSLLIAALIAFTGFRLMKDAVHVLMEGAPSEVDVMEIATKLEQLSGVNNIHNLHIWSLSSEIHQFSCHLVIDDDRISDQQKILKDVNEWVKQSLHIDRCTIQIEANRFICSDIHLADDHVHHA